MNSIDPQAIAHRFARAWHTYDQAAVPQQQIARTAYTLLQEIAEREPLRPGHILEIGCGTGYFTRLMQPLFPSSAWISGSWNPGFRYLRRNTLPSFGTVSAPWSPQTSYKFPGSAQAEEISISATQPFAAFSRILI